MVKALDPAAIGERLEALALARVKALEHPADVTVMGDRGKLHDGDRPPKVNVGRRVIKDRRAYPVSLVGKEEVQ